MSPAAITEKKGAIRKDKAKSNFMGNLVLFLIKRILFIFNS